MFYIFCVFVVRAEDLSCVHLFLFLGKPLPPQLPVVCTGYVYGISSLSIYASHSAVRNPEDCEGESKDKLCNNKYSKICENNIVCYYGSCPESENVSVFVKSGVFCFFPTIYIRCFVKHYHFV